MSDYLLFTTIGLGLLYIPYLFLYSRQTFFAHNRIYLIVSLAFVLALPFIITLVETSLTQQLGAGLGPVAETIMLPEMTYAAQDSGWSMMPLIVTIYWLVVAAGLIRLAIHGLNITRLLHTGYRIEIDGATIILNTRVSEPFTFGKLIFLPADSTFDASEFDSIIRHERVHIEKRHGFDLILMEILCAVLWINPLVHVYKRSLISIHEFQADEVASSDDRTGYAMQLLSSAASGFKYRLTHAFFTPQLKLRIKMMMRNRSPRSRVITYALALPLFAAAMFLSAAQYPAASDSQGDPAVTEISDQDNKPLKEVDEMPRFPGCEDQPKDERYQCSLQKLMQYVGTNLRYPEAAKKNNTEGRAVVKFVVEPNGLVSGAKIVKSLTNECDAEVIRVIESMNDMSDKWVPGRDKGKKVAVELVLPVQFAL